MFEPGKDQHTISFPVSDRIGNRTHSNNTLRAKNYNNNGVDQVQLGTESSKSGMCSPPLWNRSPPRSPHHRKNHYRSLSPESKTQAIARGQRELMEMVRNMPESSYELTLKDLVEKEQPKVGVEEKNKVGEKNLKVSNKNARKSEGIGKVDKRNGNIDSGGFYLKMVFPISLGSKKNKKKKESLANNNNNNTNSSKVSPRTSVSDKEWWKKKSLSESESGVSSINSGSMKSSRSNSCHSSCSSKSNSRHEMSASSCWPFIRRFSLSQQ